jgi:hypothetical protein
MVAESSVVVDVSETDSWSPLVAATPWPRLDTQPPKPLQVAPQTRREDNESVAASILTGSHDPVPSPRLDISDRGAESPLEVHDELHAAVVADDAEEPSGLVAAAEPSTPTETVGLDTRDLSSDAHRPQPADHLELFPDSMLAPAFSLLAQAADGESQPTADVVEGSPSDDNPLEFQLIEESFEPAIAVDHAAILASVDDGARAGEVEETSEEPIVIDLEEIDLNAELEAVISEHHAMAFRSDQSAAIGLWMPLGGFVPWPPLQGVRIEGDFRAVAPTLPAPSIPAPPPDWVTLIESLRQDIDRLRTEREQLAQAAVISSGHVAEPAAPQPATPVASSPAPRTPPAPSRKRRRKQPPAIQDEWGFFDPEQCGFSALLEKLDEVTGTGEDLTADS